MADIAGDVKVVYILSVVVGALLLEPFRQGFAFYSLGVTLFFKVLRSASNSLWPLTDAITVKLIKLELKTELGNSNEGYGKQRSWYSLSFGCISLVTGVFIDRLGVETVFYMYYF